MHRFKQNHWARSPAILLALTAFAVPIVASAADQSTTGPSAVITDAPRLVFPGGAYTANPELAAYPEAAEVIADNNSPLEWRGKTLYAFNSWEEVWRGEGPDAFHLRRGVKTVMDPAIRGLRLWLESTYRDANGVLYGWVHNEFPNVCPQRVRTMASGHPLLARIAALRSTDDGKSWKSLGWVMEGRPTELECDTKGTYYVGGFGDFATIVDQDQQYIYAFFASYVREFAEQGLAVARMPLGDRDHPVGKFTVWNGHDWAGSPDEAGHISPMVPAAVNIHSPDGRIFWGPSIHWNTYLKKYVMIVNQTKDAAWNTDGQYILFSDTLADPRAWTKPVKIMDWEQTHQRRPQEYGHGWYVQIVGTGQGETDKLASRTARLFLDGKSYWQIRFRNPGEK